MIKDLLFDEMTKGYKTLTADLTHEAESTHKRGTLQVSWKDAAGTSLNGLLIVESRLASPHGVDEHQWDEILKKTISTESGTAVTAIKASMYEYRIRYEKNDLTTIKLLATLKDED